MLEYWYRQKRTLVDFRRGPLGPHFDSFAAALKAQGYSRTGAVQILSKCCQLNTFLMERGITQCGQLSEALMESFLDAYTANTRTTAHYSPRDHARGAIARFHSFLIEIHACRQPKPEPKQTLYSWVIDPYLRHLNQECHLAKVTVQRACVHVGQFLAALGQNARRPQFKTLGPEKVERYIRQHLKDSPENLVCLAAALRRFLRYCAIHRHTRADYSGLIPAVRQYRHAALPKGIEDSALQRALSAIDTETPIGARDYAIFLLMMAYGIRGISVAHLLLDDIDWPHSRIRIRAQKGGKEVMLPLMEPVGEALIQYLKHRSARTPFREVFLTTKVPYHPLTSLVISHLVRGYLKNAGVQSLGVGARALRHSWAIRALEHEIPIKSIADVLGHRYIDTTFIYAKADLNSLREVALPWPKER